MSGADADAEAVDETTSDKHANVLGRANDDGTNAPDNGTDLDRALATELVGKLLNVSACSLKDLCRRTKPDARAPINEPPGIAAVMPPCTLDLGPEH